MHEARQAQQFGYEVSPRPAADSQPAREVEGRMRAIKRDADRHARKLALLAGVTLAAVLAVQAVPMAIGPALAATVFLGLMALLFLVMFAATRGSGRQAIKAIEDRNRLLSGHAWQVWPCRVEQRAHERPKFTAKRMDEVIGVESFRDFRDGAAGHRIHLLAPDGAVFRTYFGVMSDDAWHGMADGLGAVWVCGDLRFTTLMWTPGAERMWPATPESSVPELETIGVTEDRTGDRMAEPGIVDDITRSAARSALSLWLG
ncbi:hypothetical protein [Yinghuangia soli]|uniref:DUF3137 domain-containing protein n=1 Tax=Yinghuangia soli TaxID=2908204 RepID=A0AA41QAC6_9ACTN|nr:hypothetical protein [Yinghuangia soli]MCF2533127.1 hypothetical protein [Yinghuangia soli]